MVFQCSFKIGLEIAFSLIITKRFPMLHSSSSGFHDVLKSPCRVSVFQVNEQFWQKFCIYFITVLNGVVMLTIDSINNFSRIFQQSQKP